MTLRVTVTDLETGDTDSALIAAGDYILVCAEPCYRKGVVVHDGGRTHVLTVSGRAALDTVRDDGEAAGGSSFRGLLPAGATAPLAEDDKR